MKVIKRLIRQHRFLFFASVFSMLLAIFLNLEWNRFLMELIDRFGGAASVSGGTGGMSFYLRGILVALLLTLGESGSSCLASCVCEGFSHDLRMGYVRNYLRSDIRVLSALREGEEQSAMQNELADISDYFRENLFSSFSRAGSSNAARSSVKAAKRG